MMIGHYICNNERYAPLLTRRIHICNGGGGIKGYVIIHSLHFEFSIINNLIKEANLSRDLHQLHGYMAVVFLLKVRCLSLYGVIFKKSSAT